MDGARGRRLVLVGACALVGLAYVWFATLTGDRLHGGGDGPGYYTLLARAFAAGRLDLPITPAPELLALPDPWDAAANEPFRMHDLALFKGRYYLYHGAGPALLLFAPYHLLTRHDLPERIGALLLCFAAFLFAVATLRRVIAAAKAQPPAWLLPVTTLALGLSTGIPFLLNRIWVYEIAIAGGALCVAAGMYSLLRAIEAGASPRWLIAAGTAFGLAVSCRPHLLIAGGLALLALAAWLRPGRHREGTTHLLWPLLALALPMAVIGAAIASYNTARFGNPFEFGVRYILASDPAQRRVELTPGKLAHGLLTLVARAPEVSPVFPWVRQAPLPRSAAGVAQASGGTYVEPVTGALFVAPIIAAALALSLLRTARREIKLLLWLETGSAAGVLLFVAATGFATQRYLVDFVPSLALVSTAVIALLGSPGTQVRRSACVAAVIAAVASGVVVNAALALHGPYDDFLRDRPHSYLRLARAFSPFQRHRPIENPQTEVLLEVRFSARQIGAREPLLTLGSTTLGYVLLAEPRADGVRLLSRTDGSIDEIDLGKVDTHDVLVSVSLSHESGALTVAVDGRPVVTRSVTVVAAPSQLAIGENRLDPRLAADRFSGRITVRERFIGE